MRPFLYVAAITLLAVNILLGLPKVVNISEKSLAKADASNNVVTASIASGEVAGVQKSQTAPITQGIIVPAITATAVVVEDLDTGVVLFVKDPEKQVPIASTTKIMTALVASSYFKPNDTLKVPDDILSISGSTMNLRPREQLTFRSLLYGMLLNSGNDAAFAIAANYPGGINGFIEAMNEKVGQLGLHNTHFDNPAGFDSVNHYSSAADLAKIASTAIEDSQIARVVSTKQTEVASTDKSVIHSLKNLNKLLNLPGVLGIKTGTTPAAKENFIGLIERQNRRILTVVLGSDDRFGETEKLINWTFKNFLW